MPTPVDVLRQKTVLLLFHQKHQTHHLNFRKDAGVQKTYENSGKNKTKMENDWKSPSTEMI